MSAPVETAAMGRVVVSARIENLADLYAVQEGHRAPDDVRAVEVDDALVDTGATMLHLPKRLIQQLGLVQYRTREAVTPRGLAEFPVYGTVQLTIQGRDCRVDVVEADDRCPVLIGQVPLELLDFLVDPVGQRLIGNPAHGGEHMIEVL